jgi:hypothetical protein
MKRKKQKYSYKYLEKLGIKVYLNPVVHVKNKDVNAALLKNKLNINEFNRLFGIQTCPMVDDELAMFPGDCDSVICRMMTGKRTGTQHPLLWD